MSDNRFKGVVRLTEEQFRELKTTGQLVDPSTGEVLATYDPVATLYVTPGGITLYEHNIMITEESVELVLYVTKINTSNVSIDSVGDIVAPGQTLPATGKLFANGEVHFITNITGSDSSVITCDSYSIGSNYTALLQDGSCVIEDNVTLLG